MKGRNQVRVYGKRSRVEEASSSEVEPTESSGPIVRVRSEWDSRNFIDSHPVLLTLMKEKHLFEFCYVVPRYDLAQISQFVNNYCQKKTKVDEQGISLTEGLIAQVTGVQNCGLKWDKKGSANEFNELAKIFFGGELPAGSSTQTGIPVRAFPFPWDKMAIIISRHVFMRVHPSYIYTAQLRLLTAWKQGHDVDLASFLLESINDNLVGLKTGKEKGILYSTLLQRIILFTLSGKSLHKPRFVPDPNRKVDEETEFSNDDRDEAVGLMRDAASLLEVSLVGLQQENQQLKQDNEFLKQKCACLEKQLNIPPAIPNFTTKLSQLQWLHDEFASMSRMVHDADQNLVDIDQHNEDLKQQLRVTNTALDELQEAYNDAKQLKTEREAQLQVKDICIHALEHQLTLTLSSEAEEYRKENNQGCGVKMLKEEDATKM